MKNTGQTIRSRRLELQLTQKAVALAVGVDPVTVGYWERNVYKPKGEHLMRLARKLELRPEDIMDERALKQSSVERQAELIRRAYLDCDSEVLREAARRIFGTIEETGDPQEEEKP